jgi:hypothetical protein
MKGSKILKCTIIIILCIAYLQYTFCLLLLKFLLETYEIVVLRDAMYFGLVDM